MRLVVACSVMVTIGSMDINYMYCNLALVHIFTRYREKGYTLQRKFAPWIGGSLMGSFDTYHKSLKITRQEWEENPDMVLNTKNI